MIRRAVLLGGVDGDVDVLLARFRDSEQWNRIDTEHRDAVRTALTNELRNIIASQWWLPPPGIPLRDALDLVHFGVHSTTTISKFFGFDSGCAGEVEIALVAADTPFRWIRHRSLADSRNE